MKLAEFLADYIKRECEISMTSDVAHKMKEVMQAGIEAFAKAESVHIKIWVIGHGGYMELYQ